MDSREYDILKKIAYLADSNFYTPSEIVVLMQAYTLPDPVNNAWLERKTRQICRERKMVTAPGARVAFECMH